MFISPDPEFNEKVWLITRQIPEGKVSTYGQIASMIPPLPDADPESHRRLAPRWVGEALRNLPDDSTPWQRVINSQGKVSLGGSNGDKQRALLQAEGVTFDESGKVNFAEVGWAGPAADWLDEHDFDPPVPLVNKPQQKKLF
jgi:methylated-DNA-protein-cysteine methyltransferase-like protein